MGLTKNDLRMIETAKCECYNSDFRVRVGCVVTYNRSIIARGHNSNKTHTNQCIYNKIKFDGVTDPDSVISKVHAEIATLSKITNKDIDWSKVRVYTYRIMNKTSYGNARPCKACMSMIKNLGIKHIIYTTNDGIAYEKLNY